MTATPSGDAVLACVLDHCPSLTPTEALTFLYICAEDGMSLKALSKRLGEGQSTATRFVTALERLAPDGFGLVVMSDLEDGTLRRTVHLTPAGMALRDKVNEAVSGQA